MRALSAFVRQFTLFPFRYSLFAVCYSQTRRRSVSITAPNPISGEVEAVRTQYPGETLADACNKKLAELQAAGKLRFRTGPQGIQTSIAPKVGTVWERLRSQRG